MKIAFVYDVVYPWSIGGVEARIFNLAKILSRSHDVTIIGVKPPEALQEKPHGMRIMKEELSDNNVKFMLLSVNGVRSLYHRGQRRIIDPLLFSSRLISNLLASEYDIIDCQNFPYFTAFPSKLHSLMKNSRLVLTWHEFLGDYWMRYMGALGIIGRTVELVLTKLTKYHVCVSPLTARRLLRHVRGNADIRIIPNGLHREELEKTIQREKEHDLIFVGRLVRHKNVHVIIELLPDLIKWKSDFSFLIMGEGPEKQRLQSLVRTLNVDSHVRFIDFTSKRKTFQLIKSSRVLVLPSEREGFGIAAFEANACQVPVFTLSFPWNAVAYYIQQGVLWGAVARPQNKYDMLQALMTLMKDTHPKSTLDTSSFSWHHCARALEQFYHHLLDA